MSMREWAEKEIYWALKKIKADKELSDNDKKYVELCMNGALEAFKVLCGQGHSGASFGQTVYILNRLADGKPLTLIEDVPEVWTKDEHNNSGDYETYQCNRCYSLFKRVYPDGRVEYRDHDRVAVYDLYNPQGSIHDAMIDNVVANYISPITFPYSPGEKPLTVYIEEFDSSDGKPDECDTRAIHFLITPDDKTVGINRYFKYNNGLWDEISMEEYNERLAKYNEITGEERDLAESDKSSIRVHMELEAAGDDA